MDNSYIAGLFDGEGCITTYNNHGDGLRLQISITNSYKPVLEEIAAIHGGTVNRKRCEKKREHHLTL